MAKFINIDNEVLINKNEVAKVERLLYYVRGNDFEATRCDTGEKMLLEYLNLDLAEITLVSGEVIVVKIEVFGPEEGEDWNDKWFIHTIDYVKDEWERLVKKFGVELEVNEFI